MQLKDNQEIEKAGLLQSFVEPCSLSGVQRPQSRPTFAPNEERLLDIEEAAARLNISKDYLYRHHKQLPFSRRIGRKLLFSSVGISEYIRRGRK